MANRKQRREKERRERLAAREIPSMEVKAGIIEQPWKIEDLFPDSN